MIYSANIDQRTQSTEPDNEYSTPFVQIRRPFVELSGNVQQQPQRVIANSADSSVTNTNTMLNNLLNKNPHIEYLETNQYKIRHNNYSNSR